MRLNMFQRNNKDNASTLNREITSSNKTKYECPKVPSRKFCKQLNFHDLRSLSNLFLLFHKIQGIVYENTSQAI